MGCYVNLTWKRHTTYANEDEIWGEMVEMDSHLHFHDFIRDIAEWGPIKFFHGLKWSQTRRPFLSLVVHRCYEGSQQTIGVGQRE